MTEKISDYIIASTVLETPHVVVAAAIAFNVANPAIAIPLALGSHFVLEKVPHWNPHLNTEIKKYGELTWKSKKIIYADAITALILGGSIAYFVLPDISHAATILAACFFSVLPDLVEAPYYLFSRKNKFIEKMWIPFQKSIQSDTSPLPGLTTQLVTILAAFWWIMR